ncbi:hypothetical protein E8L90_15550 [Brevibacillus antibioticus]|uniref:Uncharacterized protein n=1 Tax=Brevibacillus antibioticus TaxID=2570228 RepID=A0A4U2Y854_9BACL|nr:hypothetical protein E8L90_15550 [Brevibacillus antibioticus]
MGAIMEAAPDVQEKINYQMLTFALHGNLVHFAAFKNQIGFYPSPSGIEERKIAISARSAHLRSSPTHFSTQVPVSPSQHVPQSWN